MPADDFICPNCGAEVPAKAKACPECGADEKTGWSGNTIYDGTGIEAPDEFDYNEWARRELGQPPRKSTRQWLWWLTALVLLTVFLWFLLG
jgi:RNA polymerase subunit RPABC4/transcription elongation factor Spt4